jgi:hypothetical protein
MSTATNLNVDKILSSFDDLKSFLNDPKAISQVKKAPTDTHVTPAPFKANLNGVWYVVHVATVPFRAILIIFFEAMGAIIGSFDPNARYGFSELSDRVGKGFAHCTSDRTKIYKLMTVMNEPNQEGRVINRHSFVPQSSITDPKIQKLTFSSRGGVKFNHQNGICRGMADWFISLALRTAHLFKGPREQMIALSSLYRQGGTAQAVMTHSIHADPEPSLLGFRHEYDVKKGAQEFALFRVGKHMVPLDKDEFKKKFSKLENGYYHIGHKVHATVFRKVNNEWGFFMDPNLGLYEIKGPDLAEKFLTIAEDANDAVLDKNPDFSGYKLTFEYANADFSEKPGYRVS